MIRAIIYALLMTAILAVVTYVGVTVRWDWIWLLIFAPAGLMMSYAAAETSVRCYLLWRADRAARIARAYADSPLWHPFIQARLNLAARTAAKRIR